MYDIVAAALVSKEVCVCGGGGDIREYNVGCFLQRHLNVRKAAII